MRIKKVDSNQPSIVKHLRECGLSVTDLHIVGDGVPDLMVGACHQMLGYWINLWVEIKTATGKLTPDEVAWRNEHPDDYYLIARSSEDVLRWFGMLA